MNKEEVILIIKQLRVNRETLNQLEGMSHKYRNQVIKDKLDGNILFELELLQQKLTGILYNFYMGDIEQNWADKKITTKEKFDLMDSKIGKGLTDESPFFNFGYMNSDFIDSFEFIDAREI